MENLKKPKPKASFNAQTLLSGNSRDNSFFAIILLLGLLVVVGILLIFQYYPATPVSPGNEVSRPLTLSAFKEKTDQTEGTVIIDIRSPGEFRKGHIEKALNVPSGQIDYIIRNANAKTILLYADQETEGSLKETADKISESRSDLEVYYLDGGTFNSWEEAGYPILDKMETEEM